MKKLVLAIVVLAASFFSVAAQSSKKMWVGGSVGISSFKPKGGDTYTNYSLLPEFGYIVNSQLSVGINAGFQQYEYSSSSLVATNKMEGITVYPFLRCSVLNKGVGSIFVDAGVGYTSLRDKDLDYTLDAIEIGFKPGVALKVSDTFQFTAKFGFVGMRNYSDYYEATEYGLNLDLSDVLLGVNFIF